MDLFYYWKDFEADIEAGRIGWLGSKQHKLGELARERCPDQVWAFGTVPGQRGTLLLRARLPVRDLPAAGVSPPRDLVSVLHYDPAGARVFDAAQARLASAEISALLRRRFPVAFAANFQGPNGIHPLDGDTLIALRRIAGRLDTEALQAQVGCDARDA